MLLSMGAYHVPARPDWDEMGERVEREREEREERLREIWPIPRPIPGTMLISKLDLWFLV